jgi:hypothetical protein
MAARRHWLLAFVLVAFCAAPAARAGLYNDEKKITAGDIKDLDYWHAKYYHLMLEAALQSHQPEYLVGHLAESQAEHLPDLIKKYPNHADLKKWLAQDEDVVKQVDKNADRTAHWAPDFAYWESESYRQAWVNMNLGKMEADAKDWPNAAMRYGWAAHNLGILVDREDEFMKNWPADVVKWVKDTKPEADRLAKEMKAKS